MPDRPARCEHKHLTITEYGDYSTAHIFGITDEVLHDNEPGNYEVTFFVECADCNMQRRYSRRDYPNWLQPFIDQLNWPESRKGER